MQRTRIELMPDVFLTVLHTDKFRTNCLSLNLLRPLCQEEASLNALLPDVLLRGCKMCPDMGAIAAWLDHRYGAGVQATSRKKGEIQTVGLFLDYIDESFVEPGAGLTEDIAALMGSFLLEPVLENGVFVKDYVDGEKVNLVNAIMSQINDKRSFASIRLRQEMFDGEAYGVSKYGTKEAVEAITPESLYAHYRHMLATSRVEILFAGRADEEKLVCALKNALRDLPRGEIVRTGTVLGPAPTGVKELSETMDITQGVLEMGFRTGITSEDPDYPALMLFNVIYGGGLTSKLFMNVREKLSLCYYASSGADRFKGILVVSSGIDMDNYTVTRDEILHQLDLCRRGEISDEEMNAARSALVTALRANEDSLFSMEDFYLSQATCGCSDTPQTLLEKIRSVTVEQVARVAGCVELDTIFFLKGAQ